MDKEQLRQLANDRNLEILGCGEFIPNLGQLEIPIESWDNTDKMYQALLDFDLHHDWLLLQKLPYNIYGLWFGDNYYIVCQR